MSEPLRILSIEDNTADHELIEAHLLLRKLTPIIEVAQTSEEMKQALASRQFDVVLADYSLPGFSPVAALEVLRHSGKDIPFIVVSGTFGEDCAIEMMKAGAQDFIQKGDFARLVSAIEKEVAENKNRLRRRETEIVLSETETRFRDLADAMPQLVWVTRNGQGIYYNQKWTQYFGSDMSRDDWFAEFVHPEDVEKSRQLTAEAYKAGTTLEVEFRLKRFDGVYRWFLSRGIPSIAENGEHYWFGTCTDIEDAKRRSDKYRFLSRAGAMLSSSLDYEQTLKNLSSLVVEKMADWCSIVIIGENGLPATIAVDHRDPQKVALVKEFKTRYPDNWEGSSGSAQVLRTGKPLLYSEISESLLKQSARDEEEFRFAVSLGLQSAIVVPLISLSGVVGVITLVSAESRVRYTEDDLEFALELAGRAALSIENAKLYRAAAKASQAKTEFLANMSHEIRTPLGAVLGFAELLQDPAQQAKDRQDCISVILRNGKQLAKLIDEILDLSKIESGKLELERADFVLTELVEEVTTLLNVQAQAKGISIDVNYNKNLSGKFISDPTRIRQVLINLIGNAIKFTSQGMVELNVRQENSILEFTVCDTGIGMTEEQEVRIFEPFVQGDSAMTRKFGGTGLGLALSRKLARALKGDLKLLRTEVGKGSTFVFTVEALVSTSPTAVEATVSKIKVSKASSRNLAGRRILVIDDSPDNRVLITRYLTKAGATVESVADGATGAERALKGQYHVVLMDLQMPEIDGFQALKLLQNQKYHRPILALTAHAMAGDRERCLKAGFSDHLSKPIDSDKLIAVLQAFCEQPQV